MKASEVTDFEAMAAATSHDLGETLELREEPPEPSPGRASPRLLSASPEPPRGATRGANFEAMMAALAPAPSDLGFSWTKGRQLGRGAFGTVYEAFVTASSNPELKGTFLAVKEIPLVGSERHFAKELLNLEREMQLLKVLDHPNIVRYAGASYTNGVVLIFTEYMAGGSVASMLKQFGGPFSVEVTRRYSRQVLHGLAFLHGRRIIHRDLKGANVLTTPQGQAKLSDFGSARPIGDLVSASNGLLNDSGLVGSVYWMAPEVFSGHYGRHADVWSMGCFVLEMASGRHPWPKIGSGLQMIKYIRSAKSGPPVPPGVPDVARHFLQRCCQRDPRRRPRAAELLSDPLVAETPPDVGKPDAEAQQT